MKQQHILVVHPCDDEYCYTSFVETFNALGKENVLHTTQLHFLSFNYAERLFVSIDGVNHEITLGECDGTSREIKKGHNLERLLIAGEFDWF